MTKVFYELNKDVVSLLQERIRCRLLKDYQGADEKRDRLIELGWKVEDVSPTKVKVYNENITVIFEVGLSIEKIKNNLKIEL